MNLKTNKIIYLFLLLMLGAFLSGGCLSSGSPEELGRVYVYSDPGDQADIYINGEKQKLKTHAYFNLTPGVYRINLSKRADGADDIETGMATVTVEPRREARVTITLSKMKIEPSSVVGPVALRPTSPSQKTILDYYETISKKDYQTAYNHLSYLGKRRQGGYRRWLTDWRGIAAVQVVDIRFESADASTSTEITHVGLLTTPATSTKEPVSEPVRSQVLITTFDELGGVGLPKIHEINAVPEQPELTGL